MSNTVLLPHSLLNLIISRQLQSFGPSNYSFATFLQSRAPGPRYHFAGVRGDLLTVDQFADWIGQPPELQRPPPGYSKKTEFTYGRFDASLCAPRPRPWVAVPKQPPVQSTSRGPQKQEPQSPAPASSSSSGLSERSPRPSAPVTPIRHVPPVPSTSQLVPVEPQVTAPEPTPSSSTSSVPIVPVPLLEARLSQGWSRDPRLQKRAQSSSSQG